MHRTSLLEKLSVHTPYNDHEAAMVEALQLTVSLKPQDESQRIAQREMVSALHRAADARRQRIILSQSTVGPVKWAAILLQGLCALIAIAMVHSDNRLTCAIALTIFATGIALSSLLIAAYSQPGELRTSKQAPEKPAAPLWLWERLCIIV